MAEKHGGDLSACLAEEVFSPLGALHFEPDRLLLEETPPAMALRPLLDAIGGGAHRLSEIARRINQPATSLARPMARLAEIDLVQRELPFGESERSSKKALYKIRDPFVRLWFRLVSPNRAWLSQVSGHKSLALWQREGLALVAMAWEELCRKCVANLDPVRTGLAKGLFWQPARRYWRGTEPEWDVISLSSDAGAVLLGEARWSKESDCQRHIEAWAEELSRKAIPTPLAGKKRREVRVLFVPRLPDPSRRPPGIVLLDARCVMHALR
jgi:AAA+ ATPase superfamily predicted ATPase